MSKHKNQRTARTLEKTWDTLNHLIVISSCLYRLNLKSIAQIALSVLAMIISTSLIIAAIIFIISANHKVTLTTVTVQTIKNHTEKNITTYLTQVSPERVSSSIQPTTTSPIHTNSATISPNTKSETHHTTAQTKGRITTSTQTNKPSTESRSKNPPKKPRDDYHFEVFNFVPCSICGNNQLCKSICKTIPSNKPKKKPTIKPTNKPTIKTTNKRDPKTPAKMPEKETTINPTKKPTLKTTERDTSTSQSTVLDTTTSKHTIQQQSLHSTTSENTPNSTQIPTASEPSTSNST
ncbi:attachment glycoprotein [Human respiratory syncytial virus B]|uniref:Major surface glycoprotein G n=1 Tax=Human respiratory syncytial virus B TaxID=208895 RepID=W8E0C6_HRSV|nr:attachment glycoprotein [Human respiratory syncytial virus B]